MDFHSFAASELTALARTLADAADARLAEATAHAVAAAKADAELALVNARAEADALLTLAQTEADEAMKAARADAEATIMRIRADADAAVAQARADAESALTMARSNDDGIVASVRAEAAAELERVRAAADLELQQARAASDAELTRLRQSAEGEMLALRHAADNAAKTNAAFGAMIDKLRNQQTQLAADNEQLAAENAALTYERADVLERAQASQRGPLLMRLRQTFDAVARATSVDAVLLAAAEPLAGEFARTAMFAVRDGMLVPVCHRGFDGFSGIDALATPIAGTSLLGRALQAAGVDTHRGGDIHALPFGGLPSWAVTAPIGTSGDRLALIYVDDFGQPMTEEALTERAQLVELVRAHATLRLERLVLELKASAELRAYAKMLLDEVEYVYDADASSGRSAMERNTRLADNLRCARQIYQQRVTLEGPAAASLLEDTISSIVAQKIALPFGRDLQMLATPDAQTPSAWAS